MLRLALLALLGLAEASSCPWAEDWEWQAVFHCHEAGTLVWSAEKVNGAYAAATMRMVIISTSTANDAGIEAAHQAAHDSWNNGTQVMDGAVLRPGNSYVLNFEPASWVSLFKIEVAAESNIAIFTEHMPKEFEARFHYLISDHGEEMEAAVEESAAGCSTTPAPVGSTDRMGEVFGAGVVSMLPTLLGIFSLVLVCPSVQGSFSSVMHFVNAGAAGVLFAAAVFLLLPEANHLLAVGKSEAGAAAAWGCAVLGGWLIGATSHLLGHIIKNCKTEVPEAIDVQIENGEDSAEKRTDLKSTVSDWRVAFPVLFGDFFHNLADGMVIGTAFFACDASFAWKIVGVSILHEVPQELADIFVMINKAGFSWQKATLCNVLSGLGSLLGAVIAYSVRVGVELQGAILAVGAGVFLFVACTELGPAVSASRKNSARPVLSGLVTLVIFVIAAGLIGLVLLDHEHCTQSVQAPSAETGSGEADPHAGHAH